MPALQLPGVVLGRGLAAGEDFVETAQLFRRQAELECGQGAVQLITGSWTDDRCGDSGPGQQPGEGQRAGLRADLLCQILVGLDLVSMLSQALGSPTLQPPDAGVLLLDHPTKQAALQR